jgi:hypothetical protein
VLYKNGGTFNADVMINQYIKQIFLPHVLRNNIKKPVIFLDKAPCHINKRFLQFCNQSKIKIVHIPANLTGLLQPADVSWFRTLKSSYEDRWARWFQKDPKAFSRFGNLMSPGYQSKSFFYKLIYNLTCFYNNHS